MTYSSDAQTNAQNDAQTTTPPQSPDFFGNTLSQLKKNTLLFRYFAEINLCLGLWYLHWRVFNSVNYGAMWIALPLIIAELYSYIGGVLFSFALWRPIHRSARSLDAMLPVLAEADYPTVDVLITCYNEPVDIVEQGLRAALALDYPVDKLRVFVLDDGSAPAIEAMVQQVAIEDREQPAVHQSRRQCQWELARLQERLHQLQLLEVEVILLESLPQRDAAESAENLESRLWQLLHMLKPHDQSLSQSLRAAKQQLLADISRQEQSLAGLQRCEYIARPKPTDRPHHAKAGNINYALFSGKSFGEFIVTLDTDHILEPQFLKRTLPYFYSYDVHAGRYQSNRISFVQTPQDFSNLPEGDPFCHAAEVFYGPILQGKDGFNSAFYTGTNAVMRREALLSVGIQRFSKEYARDRRRLAEFDLVGGLSTHSVTEDMITAMHLHSYGWESVFHNEVLAKGLAPDDLGSTLKQRLRWSQGTMQVLLHSNPLTLKGLSIGQRLQYFQTMYSYFAGFATLIYLICPIVYSFTEVSPVRSVDLSYLIHFAPVYIISRLTFATAFWGISARQLWRVEQYATALFPLFIQAIWSVFARQPIKFQVTPKQRQAGNYLKLVWPQMILFGLTVVGMLLCIYRLINGLVSNPWTYTINVGWSAYNALLLWSIIYAAIWQPKQAASASATTSPVNKMLSIK
jgi:cellulose synthase (UDP-forming)